MQAWSVVVGKAESPATAGADLLDTRRAGIWLQQLRVVNERIRGFPRAGPRHELLVVRVEGILDIREEPGALAQSNRIGPPGASGC
jgi:hypothetical protein